MKQEEASPAAAIVYHRAPVNKSAVFSFGMNDKVYKNNTTRGNCIFINVI
jgi:hypothetical protein